MEKVKRALSLLTVLCLSIFMLASCAGKDSNEKPDENKSSATQVEQDKTQNKDEATVYLGTRSEPQMGFDPLQGFANVDGVSIFHSNLIRVNSDLSIEKEFAKDYSISKDGLEYQFDLRDDVLCSDGEKLTSEDVKFTFEKAGESGFVSGLEEIESIDAKDNQVIFHLKKPNSLFLYSIGRLPIVPKHAYGENYGDQPIGSGPYVMKNWEKGQQMTVERNKHYFKGEPKLAKITFLFTQEDSTFEMAKKGMIDVYNVPYQYAGIPLEGFELLSFKSVGKFCASLPCVPAGELKKDDAIPIGNDVLADPAIRKAMNIAINRKELVDGPMQGFGAPAYGLVDPDQVFYNPETEYEDNNLEEAKKILDEAGWIMKDGVRQKDGVKAEFPLYAASKDKMLQDLGLMVSEQLKKIGLQPQYEVKSWEEIDKHMHEAVWVLNWGSVEPINIYYLYYSPIAGEGFYNSGYYKNEKVDEYIEKAMAATTAEEANEYWKKAQWDGTTGFSVRGDAAWLMLANKNYLYQIREGFSIGEQGNQPGTMGWCIARNIENWGFK